MDWSLTGEYETMWKAVVVYYFKVAHRHSSGGTQCHQDEQIR
jgi:hypothetical protein